LLLQFLRCTSSRKKGYSRLVQVSAEKGKPFFIVVLAWLSFLIWQELGVHFLITFGQGNERE